MKNSAVAPATVLAMLPIMVRSRVEEFIASLKRTLGDGLTSVVAYGSAVRGGYHAETSDLDVIIIVSDDAPEILERMGPLMRLARAAARVECMIMSASEIGAAADVFPLLYDDVRACHSVLYGKDVFADLVIHDEHRRLRIEQELRDARIRLRHIVASEGLAGAALAGPLEKKIKQLRSPLHALLALKGKDVADDLASVVRAACDTWRADPSWLLSPQRDPHAALRALRTVLDAAIDDVDKLVVTR